ncbi:MAG: hypothetical protein MUF51_01400 [Vicinamibacteria bacterium]|jgi:hypothetical protein|nr:hypothetical protein [Vicinamibacteria bacterium]
MRNALRHLIVLSGYVLLAAAATWPLVLSLGTQLTGDPSGDTGAYFWNLWVFRHELTQGDGRPFFTEMVFPLTGGTDLALHNYTVFADLLALPFWKALGPVASFNLAYLAQIVLGGYALFLLAYYLTDRTGVAWLAGAAFAAAPILITRGMGHYSLVAVAPLPIFVLCCERFFASRRRAWAVAAGATLAWAAFCDAYFPVFCVLLGMVCWLPRLMRIETRPAAAPRLFLRAIDVVILALTALVLIATTFQIQRIEWLGLKIGLKTLYTPALILSVLIATRLTLAWRPRVTATSATAWRDALAFYAICGVSAALLMAPLLLSLWHQSLSGEFVTPQILWRSSPRGNDALAFWLPNPHHFLAPPSFRAFIGDIYERTVSLPLTALFVALIAARLTPARIERRFVGLTLFFAALALGPFIYIGNVMTYIPGPWAFLRYLPVIGLARSPSRFAIVATLGVCILFALGLKALSERLTPARARLLIALVSALLAFELLPLKRTLYPAVAPAVYMRIAADPRADARVLDLPTGIRSGTDPIGDFSPYSQFCQAFHDKPIIGGYLSRVSEKRLASYRAMPVMNVLLALSERRTPAPEALEKSFKEARRFCNDSKIAYVVIDSQRTSVELRAFALSTLALQHLATAEGFELYETRCERLALTPAAAALKGR